MYFGADLLMRSTVPCGSCRQCCRGNSFVMLLADEGDDVESYQHEIVELPARRLGPLNHKAGSGPILKRQPNGDCVYLGPEGCTIHDRAPVICRMFDCRNLIRGHSRTELKALLSQRLVDRAIVDAGRRLIRRERQDA
jgi:Fe-S-cluster containining protein